MATADLKWDCGDVCIYLGPLNSLLEVEALDGYSGILFHHTSFMDFMHSPEWSTDYCIDAQKSHYLIVQRILQVFTGNGMCPQFSVNSMSFA